MAPIIRRQTTPTLPALARAKKTYAGVRAQAPIIPPRLEAARRRTVSSVLAAVQPETPAEQAAVASLPARVLTFGGSAVEITVHRGGQLSIRHGQGLLSLGIDLMGQIFA